MVIPSTLIRQAWWKVVSRFFYSLIKCCTRFIVLRCRLPATIAASRHAALASRPSHSAKACLAPFVSLFKVIRGRCAYHDGTIWALVRCALIVRGQVCNIGRASCGERGCNEG